MDNKVSAPVVSALVGNQSVASQVLARYRATAKEYGRYFGEQIYTVVATNPDLKWKEDVLNDKNTLRKEVNVFVVKAIDILDVKFIAKDLDGEPKIMLNPDDNDPNLVFQLVKPEFSKADRKSVAECIERIGKKGSRPMFFAAEELSMLNEMLAIHNRGVLNFYEELSRKYLKLSETVRDMMDQSARMELEYQRQCGIVSNESEVTLQVNLEESAE